VASMKMSWIASGGFRLRSGRLLCFLIAVAIVSGFPFLGLVSGADETGLLGHGVRNQRMPVVLPIRDYLELRFIAKLEPGPARENSGIVKSRRFQNVYWMHNDSSDAPRIYPINAAGENYRSATYNDAPGVLLEGAVNVDWEDITVDNQGHLIVGDVGNNRNDRRDLTLYLVEEPDPVSSRIEVLKKIVVRYPEQKSFPAGEDEFNFDCEAIFTVDNTIHLLTKHRSNDMTRLYRLDDASIESGELTYVDEFNTHGGVVAADCSVDGLRLAVATYQGLWLFERADKTQAFFDGDIRWAPYVSKQIEAVCFHDPNTLYVADEQLAELYSVEIDTMTKVQVAGHALPTADISKPYPTVAELEKMTPGAWTMVVLPDTQYYFDHTRKIPPSPEVVDSMVDWILAEKDNRNIQIVVHVGDIVDNDTDPEWTMAKGVLAKLDNQLPYVLTTGNHDYEGNSKVRQTEFNRYFKPTDNRLSDPSRGGILRETFVSGSIENAFYEFLAPDGRAFLFVSLEWGTRDVVVQWAKDVLAQSKYRKHTAVLVNHGYLYHDDTRYDWASKGVSQASNPLSYAAASTGDNNDGEMLWQKLVRQHSQFQMVLCGHVTGSKEELMALGDKAEVGYRLSVGNSGNRVHQLLFNAQRRGDAGDGWLRLMEFHPDQRTVQVKTYSPWLQARGLAAWRTDEDDYFQIKLTHF
jgi:hypothetical protein